MRKDFDKILRERPRQGGAGKEMIRKNRRRIKEACHQSEFDDSIDVENLDFRGMKRVHTAIPNSWDNKKHKSFNSAPLRRWMRSQIGKLWNDIYSEMCKSLDMNNPDNRHAYEWMVEMNTYLERGKVMVNGIPPRELSSSWSSYDEFYIDPKDGTLQILKKETKMNHRQREKKILDEFRFVNPKDLLKQYHCINGVWYEIQLRAATAEEQNDKSFGKMERGYNRVTGTIQTNWQKTHTNVITEQIADGLKLSLPDWYFRQELWHLCVTLFGGAYFPLKKMQMSSKEIRRIKGLMVKRDGEKEAD